MGGWLNQVFHHDMTFILSGDDRLLYAFASASERQASSFSAIRSDLQPLIAMVRTTAGRNAVPTRHRAMMRPGGVSKPISLKETDVRMIDGHPAAISVMPIGEVVGGDASRSPVIVSIRFLSADYLREMGYWRQIEGLRFSRVDDRRSGEAVVRHLDTNGSKAGYFFWQPQLPGTHLLWILGPLSAGLVALLLAIMAWLVRSLWRSGKQLSNAVVDLQASEAQAQHLAFHDVLTGLPNRALFNDRLDQALARARRGQPCAMLALDLDRFKQVNDTLGHSAGDQLIREFSARLNGLVRDADTVARLGGDEFSLLLSDTARRDDVENLCARILDAVRQPFDIFGNQVFVGVSIGVVLVPEAGLDRGDLVRKADIALYRAKSEGRDCYRIFTPSMDESIQLRAEVEDDLRRAILRDDEIQVHYQTEVGPDGQKIVGLEALLRWHHPTRGMIPPEQFIPIAEETGLIAPLGDFVLKEACAMAGRWPELFVAVNLSAVQFRSVDLAERIIGIADCARCNPRQIELEITESVLLEEDDIARTILERLREAGFRIALDDFGTGYSSLSYLRQFKVDKIKIDRSFTQNLGHDAEASAIVTSVVTLGHAMGLTVTAEGVETKAQMRLLSAAGCNELQGYLFSNPLPEDKVSALLSRKMPKGRDVA
ncbi:MAG: putative bifunctional diguanylate cyclase/phosphodiesterase [Sphingobium sp.]